MWVNLYLNEGFESLESLTWWTLIKSHKATRSASFALDSKSEVFKKSPLAVYKWEEKESFNPAL